VCSSNTQTAIDRDYDSKSQGRCWSRASINFCEILRWSAKEAPSTGCHPSTYDGNDAASKLDQRSISSTLDYFGHLHGINGDSRFKVKQMIPQNPVFRGAGRLETRSFASCWLYARGFELKWSTLAHLCIKHLLNMHVGRAMPKYSSSRYSRLKEMTRQIARCGFEAVTPRASHLPDSHSTVIKYASTQKTEQRS